MFVLILKLTLYHSVGSLDFFCKVSVVNLWRNVEQTLAWFIFWNLIAVMGSLSVGGQRVF